MSNPPPSPSELNTLAQALKRAHIPGKPIILPNVHDAHSASLVASHAGCQGVATASWAIAATQGVADDDMTLSQNLQGISNVMRGVANAGKSATVPVTADLQDGYVDVADTVRRAIALGVVGCNIEDVDCKARRLRGVDEAVGRVQAVLAAARKAGVPDFVVNARTDVLGFGGSIEDVVKRGRRYLEAGATTLFVWGVRKVELTVEDVKIICEGLDGRVAVQGPGQTQMSVEELREVGVARISFGPALFRKSMLVFEEEADKVLSS